MNSWKSVKLGDIADMCLGKMLSKHVNKGDMQPYLANFNVRWGSFELDKLNEMRFEVHEQDRYGLKFGDLVICEGGEPGRCAIWRDQVPKMKVQKALHRVRVNNNYNNEFVYYRLLLAGRNGDLERHFIGSTIKHLTGIGLKQIEFAYPSLREQENIAAVLSTLDAKIELNNRINAELEAMAKTLYDYWFVQFDFPFDFEKGKPDPNGKPYKSSGGKMVYNKILKRKIPDGWEAGIAADLLTFNPSHSISKGGIASYIDMNALPIRGFVTDRVEKKDYNGGVKFQNGDVVVARITPCLENGKTGLISLLEDNEIGFGSTEFIVLRGKRRSLSCFAANLARSELFRKFAIANMTGTSGRKRIEAKVLETFSLAIPHVDLLCGYERIVKPYFQIATIHTKENQQLAQLRDWLLPMLMNGQVSVI